MPVAGWGPALQTNLQAKGFGGSQLANFTNAIGNGSESHVIGKAFTTTDVGTVPGNGVGSGVGITGLNQVNISDSIFNAAVAFFGQAGSRLRDCTDSIAQVCVQQMALATLISTHNPVFVGTATVDVGSVAVVGSAWGSGIQGVGDGFGFVGSQWPNFSSAIGTGQAAEVLAVGTGTLIITGSPTGPPVPGGGTGAGTIAA